MTVNIWPSKIAQDFSGAPCQPIEKHETDSAISIDAWLQATVDNYQPLASPPISIHINGELVEPHLWCDTEFSPDDIVDIYPEPKGAEVGAFLVSYGAYIIAGIALLAVYLMPKPAIPKSSGQARGHELDEITAKGNKVKINGVIREVGGRRKIFPDYLLPPHRFFSSPSQQTVRMLLCIGVGEFDIQANDVLIGDTPLSSLGNAASYTIYGPGVSVAADNRADWWHTASEIGPTSTGASGIELTSTSGTASAFASSEVFVYSGNTITIPDGAGSWPADWVGGMTIRTDPEYVYTVTDGGGSTRDIISGDFTQLAPFVGMKLEIVGENPGYYIVKTFTPGMPDQMTLDYDNASPVNQLLTGSRSMCIGPRGLRYQIVSVAGQVMTVNRLDSDGVVDTGWPGFDALTSYDATVGYDNSAVGGWSGPFAACPDGELTTQIEWDIFFPGGLIGIDKKGRTYSVSVSIEMQYRNIATGGAWSSVTKTYSGGTLDQLGYTETTLLGGSYRPEVRIRRTTPSQNSTRVQDGAQWYGLRAKLAKKNNYAGVTTIALEIDGGNKVAAQSENQISVIATRKLPVRSTGAWLASGATRKISAWFAYVAKSIGYTDADIDLAELDRLDAIWQARGDNLDMAVESASTAKEILNSTLRAGFAEVTVDRGRLRPVRDEARTIFEQMYTPQNMKEALVRQFQSTGIDDYDGVDVEYVNGESWAVETVQCRLPGDIGRKVEKVTLDGVTDRTRAWRIGMRQRRAAKYRRKAYKFETELDAMNSRYLSYCALADDVPGYAQSAIVRSYSGGIIQSSEPLDWSAGGAHVISLRKKDGTLSGPYTATRIDDYRVSITGIDFAPDTSWGVEPPHLLFGPVNRWNYPALIVSISPNGSDGVSVEAINYDARVYADDNNSPA